MSIKIHPGMLVTIAVMGLATQLTGCASTTPELDAKFGDAVRAARDKQILNPAASANQDPVLGVDGKAAVSAQDRYNDSFKAPPKTFEVIGGSVSGQ